MRQLLAWALFDFANTFFAVAMLSFYFPLWVVETRGVRELALSAALGGSLAVVGALMPLCGALSDAAGVRMRYLRWTTYGCVAATWLIGRVDSVGLALLLFAFANVCYQLGTVFYDALLWRLVRPERWGSGSGLGAAFGYLGSMGGLLLLQPAVQAGGYQAAFGRAAGWFLLFALPCFLLVREDRSAVAGDRSWRGLARTAILRLQMTVRAAQHVAGVWRFCWASFFSLCAINTVLIFMAVYTRKVLGFSQADLLRFFLFSQVFAVAGALAFGQVIRWWGAKRTLMVVWGGWVGALGLVAVQLNPWWLWVAGPVIGFCLGSTWATARVLLLGLAPEGQVAEMLGLAGLFGRAAGIVGPLLWGLMVWDPARYRHAVVVLMGLLAVGIALLRTVPDPRPAGR